MLFVHNNQCYSIVKIKQYHQTKALEYCRKYHFTNNVKRKEVYLKLSIRHSIK